jgi:hypothetical protein
MVKIQPFDHLDNPEVIAAYLTEAFKTDDSKLMLRAIQTVARAWREIIANVSQSWNRLSPNCTRWSATSPAMPVASHTRTSNARSTLHRRSG